MWKMRRIVFAGLVLAMGVAFAGETAWQRAEREFLAARQAWTPVVAVDVRCDKPTAVVRCGEPVGFSASFKPLIDGQPLCGLAEAWAEDARGRLLFERTFDLATCSVVRASVSLDGPGFIRFSCVRKKVNGWTDGAHWGVAVEPERIVPATACPDDFDAFWDKAVATFDREVPPDVRVEKVEGNSGPGVTSYAVSVSLGGGRRMWGYLSVPTKPGAYPLRASTPGSGVGWTGLPNSKAVAQRIGLLVNVFDFRFQMDDAKRQKELYDDMIARWTKKYGVKANPPRVWQAGIGASREDSFFYGALLGANRILNWVCGEPKEVFGEGVRIDRANVVYSGQSQGGYFALAMAGLNANLTQAIVSEPAITGLLFDDDPAANRSWNYILSTQPDERARANARRFMPYFDGANFARRVPPRCEVRMGCGFIDPLCLAHGVYAAYNALPAGVKKSMTHGLGVAHGGRERYWDYDRQLAGNQVFGAAPRWAKGRFQAHFIYTGSGEAVLILYPDGTSLLIDCGEPVRSAMSSPPWPDDGRSPARKVADYVTAVNPHGRKVDYFALTHYHADHAGSRHELAGKVADDVCVPHGVGEVVDCLDFGKIVDRAWPDFADPVPVDPHFDGDLPLNLKAAYRKAASRGTKVEKFRLEKGGDQLKPLHGAIDAPFEIIPLGVNGRLLRADGTVDGLYADFLAKTKATRAPENSLSIALKFRYGDFTLYTGGDWEGRFPGPDGRDVDLQDELGKVCGKVDVAKFNHHAIPASEGFVRALSPDVWVATLWSGTQMTEKLGRMIKAAKTERLTTVEAQMLSPERRETVWRELVPSDSWEPHHVVVDVPPERKHYSVYHVK